MNDDPITKFKEAQKQGWAHFAPLEADAIIRDYMQDNVVRQDYLLTRATKL